MRELKFRAWSGSKKKMVEPMTIINPTNSHAGGDVLMQFTGLKDKNGKEVYDGDIIRFKDFTDIITAEVKWGTGQWQYKPKGWITGYSSVMVGGNIEVIGNIYDNPELLQ